MSLLLVSYAVVWQMLGKPAQGRLECLKRRRAGSTPAYSSDFDPVFETRLRTTESYIAVVSP